MNIEINCFIVVFFLSKILSSVVMLLSIFHLWHFGNSAMVMHTSLMWLFFFTCTWLFSHTVYLPSSYCGRCSWLFEDRHHTKHGRTSVFIASSLSVVICTVFLEVSKTLFFVYLFQSDHHHQVMVSSGQCLLNLRKVIKIEIFKFSITISCNNNNFWVINCLLI